MTKKKKSFRKHEEQLPGGKKLVFYHNLPDDFGMNIEGALTNWYIRHEDHSVKSLADYVFSKGTGHIILTPEEYKNMS